MIGGKLRKWWHEHAFAFLIGWLIHDILRPGESHKLEVDPLVLQYTSWALMAIFVIWIVLWLVFGRRL